MKPGSSELVIKLMNVLAQAGAEHIARPNVRNSLLGSNFYSTYLAEVTTDPAVISNQLSLEHLQKKGTGSEKFYPLPFHSPGKFDLILFRPTFFFGKTWDGCKIDLIQIGSAPNKFEMGYRIERGHRGQRDLHPYLHMQMSKNFHVRQGYKICLDTPNWLPIDHPAFPVNDSQRFAPFYAAMISFTGLQPNWQKGFIFQLDLLRNHGVTDKMISSAKKTCHALLLQRRKSCWSRIASSVEIWLSSRAKVNH